MKTWKIDNAHSEIKFKVKHLVVSTVTGYFESFNGQLTTENDNFEDANISFEADIDSINTKQEQRDGHLKSADFFDAENYPKMIFNSKSFKNIGGSQYKLVGDLTIRATTKEVELDVVYNGTVKGFGGDFNVAGFEIQGEINRHDFGLTWNGMTETGGVVVSPTVKLEIAVEVIEEALIEA